MGVWSPSFISAWAGRSRGGVKIHQEEIKWVCVWSPSFISACAGFPNVAEAPVISS